MVARIWFRKTRKTPGSKPVKLTRINDYATNRVAVPTNKLGGRVHNDVSAVSDWVYDSRACGCIVNNERQAMLVGNLGYGCDINRVQLWVTNRFGIDRLGIWLYRRFKGTWVKWIHKGCCDAKLWERVTEEVPRTAVEAG